MIRLLMLAAANARIADPFFANVSLLLHGEALVDSSASAKTLTAVGNASVSATQKKYGSNSLAFDGTGDLITAPNSVDFDFVSGAFTAEFFLFVTGYSAGVLVSKRANSATYSPFQVYVDATGHLGALASTNGTSWGLNLLATPVFGTGVWRHLALVRSGSAWTVYQDGISVLSGTLAGTLMTNTAPLCIGANADTTMSFNGYIDEVRITKGVARYTANFTPPSVPFPDS